MASKLSLQNNVNFGESLFQLSKAKTELVALDGWYGPWQNLQALESALSTLNSRKSIGVVTVAIWNEDKSSVTEYWNPDASLNFVKKTVEASLDTPIDIDLSDYVSKDELEEKIGTYYVAAQGEEGEEGYVPAVDATGLRAEIEAVNEKSKKRFNTMLGIVEGVQIQQHNDLVEVQTNLDKNLEEAQQQQHDDLVEVHTNLQKNMDDAVARLEQNIKDVVGKHSVPAIGEEGSEEYVPAVEATGLLGEIEAVNEKSKKRFNTMLGIVQGVQEQQHADLVEVQTNLHGNIEEAQQQQHNDLVEVHTNLQKNIDDAVASLREAIKGKANEAHEHPSLASKDYVDEKVADLVGGAPETLNTLKEIGDALGAHEDEYGTLLEVVGSKVSSTELAELIGTPHEAAVGTEGEEGYKPVVPATGLHADIESVAYRRFMQMLEIVQGVQEQQHADLVEVQNNLHGNIEEAQQQQHDDLVEVHTNLQKNMDDAVARLEKNIEDTVAEAQEQQHADLEEVRTNLENSIAQLESKEVVSAIDERVQSLESIDHSKFLTEHQDISNLASKEYVNTKVADLVNGAPETLDTLKEISDAIAAHEDEYDGLIDVVAQKASKAELAESLKDVVKLVDVSTEANPDRHSIILENHDLLIGKGANCEDGQPNGYEGGENLETKSFNLAMVSKWNVADFGSSKIKMNLNSKDGKVFVNDKQVVATEKYVDDAIADIEIPSLNGYATEEWVESKNYLTEHQDISGKQDVIEDLETIREGAALGATALQEHQSLEGYVPKAMYDDLCEKFYKLLNKMQAYDDRFGYISIDGQVEWAKDLLFADEGDNEILFNIINGMGIAGNREALVAIMNDNDTDVAVLRDDIEIRETISINDGKTKEIKLNGQSIKNGHIGETNIWTSNCDAVTVNDGTLTISGNGKIETLSRAGSPIYAHTANATINIKDGFYLSNGLNPGKGWSLVYADGGAKINISGGYFAVVGKTDEKLYEYVLNCKDNSGSVITLTGGYFYEADPRKHDHPEEVVIAEGYAVEVLENAEFKGLTGTWYHVVEI